MFLKCQPFITPLNYISIDISLAHVEKSFQTILPREQKHNADISDNICRGSFRSSTRSSREITFQEHRYRRRAKWQIRTKRAFRARSLSKGWHSAYGRIATTRYLLARCYRGLWFASTPERLYDWKLNGLRESSTTARNSSLVNSKVSRIFPFFFSPEEERLPPLTSVAFVWANAWTRFHLLQKPDVRQLSGKRIIRFALTVARLKAFVVIVGKSFQRQSQIPYSLIQIHFIRYVLASFFLINNCNKRCVFTA